MDYQSFEAMIKNNGSTIKSHSIGVRLLIEVLQEEIKLVVAEAKVFEMRHNKKNKCFIYLDSPVTDAEKQPTKISVKSNYLELKKQLNTVFLVRNVLVKRDESHLSGYKNFWRRHFHYSIAGSELIVATHFSSERDFSVARLDRKKPSMSLCRYMNLKNETFHCWEHFWHCRTISNAMQRTNSILIKSNSLQKKLNIEILQQSVVLEK